MASSNSKQLIGLSLSQCVKDIAASKVRIDNVRCIVTSTRIIDDEGWIQMVDDYRKIFDWGDTEEEIFWELFEREKVEQPRLTINNYPDLAGAKVWVMSREQIRWEYDNG